MTKPIGVLITGWSGLLGFHARAVLTAHNSHSVFKGGQAPYSLVLAPRIDTANLDELRQRIASVDVVLHLAGVNRAGPAGLKAQNAALAELLVEALQHASSRPHVIYANSTHALCLDTAYGRDKQRAHETLLKWSESATARYTNVVIPHVFGENSRPFYNTVTATLCQHLVDGTQPEINPSGRVELIHAGDVIDEMIHTFNNGTTGTQRLNGYSTSISDLYDRLHSFKVQYDNGFFPVLQDPLQVRLFNTYRSFEFPTHYPRALTIREDKRGTLFEAVKGGGGGQTFLSWTEPGVERGNHFHRHKVERFLVVSGQAEIRVRQLFDNKIHRFTVCGEQLQIVDMPTLSTHSIVNTGKDRLLTLFWANEIFDPDRPDTYAQPVVKDA